jgi:predicted dehydrogenase
MPPYAILDKGDVIDRNDIEDTDWAFVCTPPVVGAEIVDQLRDFNDRILIMVEKPYLGNEQDIYVGYNYRFYTGISMLLNDIFDEVFGDLISVNMTFGFMDTPDSGWRRDPIQSGGGALLDLGVHLADLAMLISHGNLTRKTLVCNNNKMGVDEESHILAKDNNGCIYNLQVSKVRQKSIFRIEVNGTKKRGLVEGRNRHYGRQVYSIDNKLAIKRIRNLSVLKHTHY